MAAALPEGGAAASLSIPLRGTAPGGNSFACISLYGAQPLAETASRVYPFTGHSPWRKQLRAGWKNGKNREWKLQINFSLCIFVLNIFS